MFTQQQQRVLAQRGKTDEARQLAVDVAVLREQVANSAKRAAEFEQEAQSVETGLSFLGNAVTPTSPSFPKVPLVILAAISIGLALGIGLALLSELLKRRVRGPSDLDFDGVPLLGIAHLERPARGRLTRLRGLLPAMGGASGS